MTLPNNNFPGVRALVDVIGQMEAIDFNLMFRLLREGVTLEQLRKFYWERADYLFMAPVHTVIDIARFTFTWRGRVLIARAFPDTSSLSRGDVVLIRRLPASTEYFTIIYGIPPVLIAARIDLAGSTFPMRFAYTLNILDPSPEWVENSAGLPPNSTNTNIQLFGDGATEYMILAQNGDDEMWRNVDPLEAGVWTKVLDLTLVNTLLSLAATNLRLFSPTARVSSDGTTTVFVIVDLPSAGDFLFHSHDEGNSWDALPIPPDFSVMGESNYYSLAVGIRDPDKVYVYGSFNVGVNKEERVAYSTDGGHSLALRWDQLVLAVGFGYLGMPFPLNPNEDILFIGSAAAGGNRPMVRSTDGGQIFAAYSSELHRPVFSRTTANSMWDVGNPNRRVWRSSDAGLTYLFADVGAVANYNFQDAILHKDNLFVVAGQRGTVVGVPTGPTIFSSPDKITFTGRDGNIDTAFFHGFQAGQRPTINAVDFYGIVKQSTLRQG